MAEDEELAHRVRELLGEQTGVSEQRMFGGLAFLLNGNLALAVSRRGLLVRVGPEAAERALATPGARPMQTRGRPMRGWIVVDPEAVPSRRQLAAWVRRGVGFAGTLAPKG
jgi:TfoX/Sxy family transcriptional regulator of competence genes